MKNRFLLISFTYLICLLYGTGQILAQERQAKYVFYFIGDGMGVNQVNATEMYFAEKDGKIGIKPLNFTQFPVCTMVNTYSASNTVTCSAAAGTALATGYKTSAGTISLDSTHNILLTTIAEKAKKAGKKVGITTNVSIDHATPATFYAHQPNRKMAYEIGTDLAKSGFDFFAGSGFVQPESKKGRNLLSIVKDSGYIVAKGYDDFKIKYPSASKIILFQEDGKDINSLPYHIDREKNDLTLPQITEGAIQFLTKDNSNGFFLMVEGGKIDWACHGNDGATVFGEIADFADAIQVALNFYKQHPNETLIIITADHETGGIILGTKNYSTNLKILENQRHSQDVVTAQIKELRSNKKEVEWEDIQLILKNNFGFWDKVELTEIQENRLKEAFNHSFIAKDVQSAKSLYSENEPIASLAKNILNEIALLGWGSDSHTAGYVPLYAVGIGAEQFTRKMDNTEIPKTISRIAGY